MIIEEGTHEDFKHCALTALSTGDYADGLGAPLWLIQRMKNLRNLPPPTLEEVRAQFEASANWEDNRRARLPDRYS
jgi:hypothetical protein